MKRTLLILLTMLAVITAEAQQRQTVYARSSIRCMGVELDGSQTLRVQGYGRNRADAKEQAMKNAVWAVIFDGIRDGADAGCNMRQRGIHTVRLTARHQEALRRQGERQAGILLRSNHTRAEG